MNLRFFESQISCGVKQITGVSSFGNPYMGWSTPGSDGVDGVRQIKEYIKGEFKRRGSISEGGTRSGVPGFVFSCNRREKNPPVGGQGFAAYLKSLNIGEVTESPVFTNYNTGNRIRNFFFTPTRAFVDECLGRKPRKKTVRRARAVRG